MSADRKEAQKVPAGEAWLVRDKYYKMRRAIFFHPDHAEKYRHDFNYLGNKRTEVVKIRLKIEITENGK